MKNECNMKMNKCEGGLKHFQVLLNYYFYLNESLTLNKKCNDLKLCALKISCEIVDGALDQVF